MHQIQNWVKMEEGRPLCCCKDPLQHRLLRAPNFFSFCMNNHTLLHRGGGGDPSGFDAD